MNLVVCRNLLIYLGPELQRKVVPILHYALKPSGFLFLGNAESVAGLSEFFAPVDKKHKIFVKKAVAGKLHYDFSANRYPRETAVRDRPMERSETGIGVDRQQEADHIVLKTYAVRLPRFLKKSEKHHRSYLVSVVLNDEGQVRFLPDRVTITPLSWARCRRHRKDSGLRGKVLAKEVTGSGVGPQPAD